MKKWILLAVVAFVLQACDKDEKECPKTVEKTYDLTGFTRVNAGETFNIDITRGETFSVRVTGCENDLADLDVKMINGHTLDFGYATYKNNRYQVDIIVTLPQLYAVSLSGAAHGKVKGFGGQPSTLRSVLSGVAECAQDGTGINAQFDISGNSVLHLSGQTESLFGYISGNGRLNGYNMDATDVDISTTGNSRAYVKPLQLFFAEATGNSRIYYKGNPPSKNLVTSGNGKIINE